MSDWLGVVAKVAGRLTEAESARTGTVTRCRFRRGTVTSGQPARGTEPSCVSISLSGGRQQRARALHCGKVGGTCDTVGTRPCPGSQNWGAEDPTRVKV